MNITNEEQRALLVKLASERTDVFMSLYRNLTSYEHQRRWCKRVDNYDMKRQLDLEPRDHGKSVVFTESYPLRMICRDPRIRILIVSKTSDQAKKFLGVIKQELETNELIIRDFGDMSSKGRQLEAGYSAWQQDRIYCRIPDERREDLKKLPFLGGPRPDITREATVEAIGVGGAVTGGHFDVMILDDILDDENTMTETRGKRIDNWFDGTIMQLVESHTKTIVVGTRKDPDDLYGRLIDIGSWNHNVESAIISPPIEEIKFHPVADENGVYSTVEITDPDPKDIKVLWREEWWPEKLLHQYRESPLIFRREKQNEATGYDIGEFSSKDINWYPREDMPDEENSALYIGVDPSTDSQSSSSDYTCMASLIMDRSTAKMYMHSLERVKLDAINVPKRIKRFVRRQKNITGLHPHIVSIEGVSFQRMIAQQLLRDAEFPVRESSSKATQSGKTARFRALAPKISEARVSFPQDKKDMWEPFVLEWSSYGSGHRHDDTIDAVEIAVLAATEDTLGDKLTEEHQVLNKSHISFNQGIVGSSQVGFQSGVAGFEIGNKNSFVRSVQSLGID